MGEDTCIGIKSIETAARRTNPQYAGIVLDDGCYPVVAQASRIKQVVLKANYLSRYSGRSDRALRCLFRATKYLICR